MAIEWEGEGEYVAASAESAVVAAEDDDVLDVVDPDMDMNAFLRSEIPKLMKKAVGEAMDVKEIIPVLNMAQKLVEANQGAKGVNEWKVTVKWV